MPSQQGGMSILYAYAAIFFIFYILVFRPQQQKQKELKNLLGNLKKNDEVITNSGIHGTIVLVKDKTVMVRVDENVKIEFDREAIATVIAAKT